MHTEMLELHGALGAMLYTWRRMALWSIVLVGCIFASCPAGAAGTLRVAIEGEYPPFSFVDGQGNLAGFDVDIALALCKVMDAQCELVKTPWEGIIDRLDAGDFDVIVASMSYTPDRAQRVEFTDKYYRTTSSYIARAGSGLTTSSAGLRGRHIATQEETVHADYLAATFGSDITLTVTDTLDQSFDLLLAGKVDAVLCNSLTAFEFLQSPKGDGYEYVGDPLSEKSLSSTANIAVRKGETALRDALNTALGVILQNGDYDRINRAYFPFSIY